MVADCAVWTGALNGAGYGVIRGDDGRLALTHRVMYEHLVGPIPVALVLDHLCRRRDCWHPGHVEPVTIGVNTDRGLWGTVWREYRLERQRQEDQLEADCIGYDAERADLLARGRHLVTFEEWLEAWPFPSRQERYG